MTTENLERRVVEAREALDSMDDFARMANIDAIGPRQVLTEFIDFVAALGAQEPIAQVDMNKASCVHWLNSTDPDTFHGTKLYAAPVLPPEDWQLVPKNLTQEMLEAADNAGIRSYTGTWIINPIKCYEAILAAAPEYKP